MLHIPIYALSLLAGIPSGLMLKSNSERRLRGNMRPWLPFGSASLSRLLLGIAVKLVLVLPLFFIPLWMVSEIGHRFAVSYVPGVVYVLYLSGILIGKGLRFGYWRRKG